MKCTAMMMNKAMYGGSIAMLSVALLLSGCSASKKASRPMVSPAALPTPVVDTTLQRVPDAVIRDTVTLFHHGALVQDANSGIFQQLMTPEQKAEALYTTGIDKRHSFTPAMHYDLRKPQFVVIHHTSQNSLAQTIRTFQLSHTQVSSHYVIGRDGQIVQMLNDYMRSWHAGAGKWGSITDMNSVSIGIELDNNGREPFSDAQINALLSVLQTLKAKYRIPQTNFIGHSDYAPGRKDDPSSFFPWEILAENGFGLWYNESYLQPPPATFNSSDALRIIGYDTSNLRNAIRAFKKKFIRKDTSPELTPYDVMVLYDLYRKYY